LAPKVYALRKNNHFKFVIKGISYSELQVDQKSLFYSFKQFLMEENNENFFHFIKKFSMKSNIRKGVLEYQENIEKTFSFKYSKRYKINKAYK
jgi:hypothetical protein